MESSKVVKFDGLTYRVEAAVQMPDRDAMAEVAKLIGMQPTPMIMEAQGYDWSSNGHDFTRLRAGADILVFNGVRGVDSDCVPARKSGDTAAD